MRADVQTDLPNGESAAQMKSDSIPGGSPAAAPGALGWHSRRALISGLLTVAAAGCAFPTRLAPVPPEKTVGALPLGLTNARFFPSVQGAEIFAEGKQAVERQRAALGLATGAALPPSQFLALSGGGDDGAFGADPQDQIFPIPVGKYCDLMSPGYKGSAERKKGKDVAPSAQRTRDNFGITVVQ